MLTNVSAYVNIKIENKERKMNRGFNSSFDQQTRVIPNRRRISNKKVAIWIAIAVLYFFLPHIAVLLFVAMFYAGKIGVSLPYKHLALPALGCIALASFIYPQAVLALRVSTLILFVLYLCGRFGFRMK